MKESEEDINIWKDISCSWIGRNNDIKLSILLRATQIQCNPYQIIKGILAELEQRILKFVWNHKSPHKAEAPLRLGCVMTWIYHQSVLYKFHCFRNLSCLIYSPLPPKPCFYCTHQIQISCVYIQFKIFSNISCDFFFDL